jgi:hypothetical protein
MNNQLYFQLMLMKCGFHDLVCPVKPKVIFRFFSNNHLLKNLAPISFLLQSDELKWMLFSHCSFNFEEILDIFYLWSSDSLAKFMGLPNQPMIISLLNFKLCETPMLGLRPRSWGEYIVPSFMCRSFMEEMYPSEFLRALCSFGVRLVLKPLITCV